MRSELFVPGSRPELFAKALASAADALSFDLEDAVPEARKAEGRTAVAAFLASDAVRQPNEIFNVRVNALASALVDGRMIDPPEVQGLRERGVLG